MTGNYTDDSDVNNCAIDLDEWKEYDLNRIQPNTRAIEISVNSSRAILGNILRKNYCELLPLEQYTMFHSLCCNTIISCLFFIPTKIANKNA